MALSNNNDAEKHLNLMACDGSWVLGSWYNVNQTVEWIIYDIHKKLHDMLSRHVNTMLSGFNEYKGNHWKQIKPNFDKTFMFRKWFDVVDDSFCGQQTCYK